jgi:hypothetical protein
VADRDMVRIDLCFVCDRTTVTPTFNVHVVPLRCRRSAAPRFRRSFAHLAEAVSHPCE